MKDGWVEVREHIYLHLAVSRWRFGESIVEQLSAIAPPLYDIYFTEGRIAKITIIGQIYSEWLIEKILADNSF